MIKARDKQPQPAARLTDDEAEKASGGKIGDYAMVKCNLYLSSSGEGCCGWISGCFYIQRYAAGRFAPCR